VTLAAALAALLLPSCGGDSPTSGKSLEEFSRALEGMKTPFEGPCDVCNGEPAPDPDAGREGPCPACGGTGKVRGMRGPTLEEFTAVFGEPVATAKRPGDLIWQVWTFQCREGRVRLPVYLEEEPGDAIRVVTGEPVPDE